MKMSLAWHRECLHNAKTSLMQKEKHLAEETKDVQAHRDRILMYEQQIKRAEEEGKADFDRDKFGRKK